ncbi:MAG TPA: tetratricopeptide repeat protein [Verrucomicrobiae bacterium]
MKRISLLLIVTVTAAILAGQNKTPESTLGAALHQEEVQGDLKGAIAAYNKLLAGRGLSHKVAAEALYHLGLCYQKLGDADARKAFERLLAEYPDQTGWVAQARARLAALGAPAQPAVVRAWTDLGSKGVRPIDFAISPDGTFVAYGRRAQGGDYTPSDDIWVHPLAGGEDRAITKHTGGTAALPVVSPDGRFVAYSRAIRSTMELRVANVDGSGDRALVSRTLDEQLVPYAWSPGGANILVGRNDSRELGMMQVVGGGITVLQSGQNLAAKPNAFSPDGKYVVYTSGGMTNSRIWIMSTGGGGEIEIASDPAGAWHNGQAGWTPDGRLLFWSNRSGSQALYWQRMAEGKPQGEPVRIDDVRLAPIDEIGRAGVQVARDGSLFYAARTRQTDVYTAHFDPASMQLTSAPQRLNQRYVGDVRTLSDWSPDGGSILYTSVQPAGGVVVHSFGGNEEREIKPSGWVGQMRFFPDGQSVMSNKDGRMDLRTGIVSALGAKMPNTFEWDLSPDMQFLYYGAVVEPVPTSGPRKLRFIRRSIVSGEETDVLSLETSRNQPFNISVSPDGKQVSFNYWDAQNPSHMWLAAAHTEGGPVKQLVVEKNAGNKCVWTKDGKHLLCPRANEILVIPADGGASHPLSVGMNGMGLSDLALNPANNLIAFTATQTRIDLMSYKNVFPPASPR